MKMMMYGVAIVASFALAAGGSWYLTQKDKDAEEQTGEDVDPQNADGKSIEKPAADPNAPANDPQPSAMPPQPMTAEDFVRMGVIFDKRKKALAKREADLDEVERRQKLILSDIDAEQRVADGILSQMRSTLDSSEQLLAQIVEKQAEVEAMQPAEAETDQTQDEISTTEVPSPDVMKNIKHLAELYQNIEPGRASSILTKMANEGDTARVVWIFKQFDKKKAAQVLDQMADSDSELVLQITKLIAQLPQPVSTKKRR